MLDILIRNAVVMPMKNGKTDLMEKSYIAVQDGKIYAVGDMASLKKIPDAVKIINAKNCLVMPGLVNTHTHAAMTLFRGLADDLPLMDWLEKHIFPAEARFVKPDMVYWCTKLAVAEMLLSGTTTVADGYFYEHDAAQAFLDAGIRAFPAQGIIDFPAPGVPDPNQNVQYASDYLNNWQNKNTRITPALFCHSPYTCSPETLSKAKKAAKENNSLFFIHVAETEFETHQIKEKHGKSIAGYLNYLGILDPKTVCVHCVHLDEEDLKIIKKSGAKIATCTESNMKLASGVVPVSTMLRLGIPIGIGTDGCASNNNLDMFTEMDSCAKLQKVISADPTNFPASLALNMATLQGAAVLGLDSEIGSIEPGKKADIIILDLNQPHLTPFYNGDNLVYGANGSDVISVIIDGELIMENRRVLSFDVQEAIEQVRVLSREVIKAT